MDEFSKTRACLGVAMPFAMIAIAPSAQAQETGEGEQANQGVTEIIVTANRRAESQQDVPIAISAISAESAAARGINDIAAIQSAVPGVVINHTANEGNIFVRGVGTNLFGPNSEQTVALFVDNVYHPSPEANLFTFNNIERIEVLKGPQGTLFGRNTTGGVVHIITRDPPSRFTGEASLGYANYDTVTGSVYLGGPVSDTLRADISAQYADQGDGWGENLNTGRDNAVMADNNLSLRSKMLFEPSSATQIVLTGDYSRSTARYSYQLAQGVTGVDGVSGYPGEYNTVSGLRDLERLKTGGVSLQIDQAIGAMQLISITSYRESSVDYLLDQDDTPAIVADLSLPSKAHNWTQELRLHSSDNGPVTWVLGGFLYNATAGYTPADINNGVVVIDDRQETLSLAGFGQATAEILTDTNLTLGLRYTYEDQELIIDDFAVGGASIPLPDQKQTFKKLTWRAALDHKFTPDVLGYVSYNRGFKSGGFNLLAPDAAPFDPEVLDAYEIGLKTELFGRRLRANFSAFQYDYENIQVTIPQLGSIVTRNAAQARIRGIEATFEARPVPALNLDANIAVLDGKYTEYPNALFIAADGTSTDVDGNPLTIDAKGNRTISTPELTLSFGGSYLVETDFGDLSFAANAAYNDGFFFYADNRLVQPDYWLLNASVTYALPGDQFALRFWAKNLTDATYFSGRSEQAGLGDAQRQAAPRTYGATLTARF